MSDSALTIPIRAMVQYRQVERVPSLFNNPNVRSEEKDLLTQLLFSYKLNPQTVLFVGYSDFSLGDLLFGFSPLSLGRGAGGEGLWEGAPLSRSAGGRWERGRG